MTGKRRQKVCHFAFTEDVKVAENIKTWWDIETYASKINVNSHSKKELQAQKMLESTTKFTGERYEVGMLWSEPGPKVPNNYNSALGQLYSVERRFQKVPNLKSLYQQSIDTDLEKGFVNILDESEVKNHLRERMVFATPSSAKPEQAWQSKTCLKCRIKVQRIMPK